MASKTRLAQAYYDLAVMLDAGMPILRSLDILIQGRKGSLKRVLSQVRESLSQGSSLAESMGRHRRVFPDLDRMLVEAAETSGSLGDSFKMLSQWHEFMHRIAQRIGVGLIYPALIFHIGAFVFGFATFLPNFPTGRQYLIKVVSILLLFYVPAAVVILVMRMQERVPAVRYPLDFLVLRIPILGAAIYHLSICRYAKAFSMMYRAGVPISETTERATRATGNAVVARLFKGGANSVRQGGSAWEGYSKRMRPEYYHLWQVGEETGEIDKSADKIAEIASDRADLLFTQFAFWMPWFVYAMIAAILIWMIFRLFYQVYGGLLNSTESLF
jgi:type II secretory pathway component PulF